MDERNLHTLEGLLRFALQHTKSEDAPNPSIFQEMDPERKQFLENVLKSMSVNVIEEFRKAIETLESEETSPEEKCSALTAIGEYVDNIDFANNFVKIGGSKIIISCLNSDNPEIQRLSAGIIAELTQNNPVCQKHFTQQDVLPKLVDLLNTEKVGSSSLHAISCLVRHNEDALVAFLKIGGIKRIVECLKKDRPGVFIKACFLLNAVSTEFPIIKGELLKIGAFEKISDLIEPIDDYNNEIEIALSTLDTLSTYEGGCGKISSDMKDKLSSIIEKCKSKEECKEIVEYSRNLLNKCVVDNASEDKVEH